MTITHNEIQALVDEMGRGAQAWVNGKLEHMPRRTWFKRKT